MTQATLSALYRFPVKSLAGEAFQMLDVHPTGPALDRRWMLVDAQGRFITQRQQPRMTLISARVDAQGGLRLRAPGMQDIEVGDAGGGSTAVSVWDDRLPAACAGAEVDAWLSRFLAVSCRLVRFRDDVGRPVDPDYARPTDRVAFADGFPFLLISQASLDDLNSRLEQPVSMLRFRPNLVVQGCEPYAEDGWRRIRIGGITFRVAKPCSRCVIPTVDLDSGERGREPLQTLMRYRRRDNKVYFGQNLIHDTVGHLQVGMPVEVLE